MRLKNYWVRLRALSLALILFSGLLITGGSSRAEGPKAGRTIDFSVVAVMGDSLSQAYNDGVLHSDAQSRDYVRLLSNQFGFELRQALIAEPGGLSGGKRVVLQDPTIPIRPLAPSSFLNLAFEEVNMGRVDPTVRVNNFAVGGAKVRDVINARPTPENPPLFAALGIPWLSDNPPVSRSQLEFVEAMNPKPTTVILWIGNNDPLAAASKFDPSLLTPLDQFTKDYEEIVRRTRATGAEMILVPLLATTKTPIARFIPGSDVALIFRVQQDLFTKLTGINANDYVTPFALPTVLAVVSGKQPGPVPDNLVARAAIIKKLLKGLKRYNSAIAKIAKKENLPFVELGPMLDQLSSPNGLEIPGVAHLTNRFFGGFFSLDGTHITATANALVANEMIKTVNKFYGTNYPLVDVVAIAKADPQVPKDGSSFEAERIPTVEEWMEAAPRLEAVGERINNLLLSSTDQ